MVVFSAALSSQIWGVELVPPRVGPPPSPSPIAAAKDDVASGKHRIYWASGYSSSPIGISDVTDKKLAEQLPEDSANCGCVLYAYSLPLEWAEQYNREVIRLIKNQVATNEKKKLKSERKPKQPKS